MIVALIHPDGRLTPLAGEFTTDPTSIAALGHAVHAAGHELALRTGTSDVRSITLNAAQSCLTLLPVPQGVLLLEHDPHVPHAALQLMAQSYLSQPAAPAPVLPTAASLSLADALHATAP